MPTPTNIGGGPRRPAALVRPIGPAISVPGVKPRTDGVDFDACVGRCAGAPFALPSSRIDDANVPNGPLPVNIVERVRYHATQLDLEWLESAREQLARAERAALTSANFEAIVTALELAANGNEGLPVGRVVASADALREAGVEDATLLKPASEAVAAVRRYWSTKRTAAANRPLIPGLLFWPHEGACPPDTPFLNREADIDVWVRKAPTQPAPKSAQRELAEPILAGFATNAVLLAEALLARETKRLEHSMACVHELAAVRAANGIGSGATADDDGAIGTDNVDDPDGLLLLLGKSEADRDDDKDAQRDPSVVCARPCTADVAAAALAVQRHGGAVAGMAPGLKAHRSENGTVVKTVPATPTKPEPR